MINKDGFAIVGCTKCRRMQVADLSYTTKTCVCGNKIDLAKTKLLAVVESADAAGELLRQMQTAKNSGFTPAVRIAQTFKKMD
ncbi:hypothetical protein SDC9_20371 [bioreactor metagenome]|uniref:DUF1922 domain-containing protein n=1 Tax=bioreactor metagenome TaxID=1076179 RepID=A0A644U6K4_9ZZZZ|nr:DUF1922 domain-containing protein [Methanocorpusculum sp.]